MILNKLTGEDCSGVRSMGTDRVLAMKRYANLQSPMLLQEAISNRDWKLLKTPATPTKQSPEVMSNRDKMRGSTCAQLTLFSRRASFLRLLRRRHRLRRNHRIARRSLCDVPPTRARNIGEQPAARNRLGLINRNVVRAGIFVAMLDQQPRFLRGASEAARAHEHPGAVKLLPMQYKFEIALFERRADVGNLRLPRPVVPHHHRPAAIFARGNDSLETGVINRMIFHMHRQTLHRRIGRRPFRNRPREQHSMPLQPKIVMQPRRRVFLHPENPRRALPLLRALRLFRALFALRLGRNFKTALAAIFFERHKFSSSRTRISFSILAQTSISNPVRRARIARRLRQRSSLSPLGTNNSFFVHRMLSFVGNFTTSRNLVAIRGFEPRFRP